MSVICTLFEGHYHYGVAALTNSLYKHDFRGDIYVGYRGDLPLWVKSTNPSERITWNGALTFEVTEGICLHFLPVETTFHLANYKPYFIKELWKRLDSSIDNIFYFDPDIVIKCKWDFFEEWVQFGVCLVHESVYHNMFPSHPKRHKWNPVIKTAKRNIERDLYSYFNSGFIGVSKKNFEFIEEWVDITETMVEQYDFDVKHFQANQTQSDLFPSGDQDAMNITAMCCKSPLSEFGPEGMDFSGIGWLMSHATCQPKPWKMSFFRNFFEGNSIDFATKAYWQHANGIIKPYSDVTIRQQNLKIKMFSLLNRFYCKR